MTNGVGEPWGAHILKIKHNYRHLGKDVELDIVESLKLVRDDGLVLRGATAALREGGLHVRPADVRAPSELCQPRRTDHLGALLLCAHEACCLAGMIDEAQEAWLSPLKTIITRPPAKSEFFKAFLRKMKAN